jgi:hypothetical protein
MKRKLPEKFFEQNQRAKTRKWKFFNLSQALWGAGNREFRLLEGRGAPKGTPLYFYSPKITASMLTNVIILAAIGILRA